MPKQKEYKYYCAEICQQLKAEYYANQTLALIVQEYEDAKQDTENTYNVIDFTKKIGEFIYNTLFMQGFEPIEVHCVIHDADIITETDFLTGEDTITPKEDHFHCMCKFRDRVSLSKIAYAVGLEGQQINKPQTRGSYSWINMVGYTIHAADEEKHQYNIENVYSHITEGEGKPFDYYYQEYGKYWEQQRIRKQYTKNKININTLLVAIDNRTIRTKSDIMKNPDAWGIYLENSDKIDKRLKHWLDYDTVQALAILEQGKVKKQIVYVWGVSNSGKTTIAHEIAEKRQAKIKEEEGTEPQITVATSSHPMEDLEQAGAGGIVIFDDVSSNCLGRDDWLTLLSANPKEANKTYGARYNNLKVCPFTIIISNVVSPYTYFSKVLNKDEEDTIDQFIRRICLMIEVIYKGETIPRNFNLYLPVYEDPKVPIYHTEQGEVKGNFYLEQVAGFVEKEDLFDTLDKALDGQTTPEDVRKEKNNKKEHIPDKRKIIVKTAKGKQQTGEWEDAIDMANDMFENIEKENK